MTRLLSAALCAAITLISGPAFARPIVKLQLHASKTGRIVHYTIVATNTGADAALDLTPAGKIPGGTKYVPGSGRPAASLEFTVDGRTWSSHPQVTVRIPDGKSVMKSADTAAYTGLRWHLKNALAAHKSASFTYEVIVK